nr:stage III sporulation protein AF [Priestia taiwanensis]
MTEWVNTIVVFILLATIITMLLPNSALQKYVKMVISLMLIVIILNPLFKLLKTDVNAILYSFDADTYLASNGLENQLDSKKKEIQEKGRAYILEEMAVRLKKQVKEEMLKKYGVELVSVQLEANEGTTEVKSHEDIQHIRVVVKPLKMKEGDSVQTVKEIVIDTEKPLEKEKQQQVSPEVTTFLATKWEVAEEQILISEERVKR